LNLRILFEKIDKIFLGVKQKRKNHHYLDYRIISELKVKQGDLWRVFKIMSEFVMGFDELSRVAPGVTIFGSSRISQDNEYYKKAYELGYMLGKEGYSVITGGGPGVMEAANKGAYEAGTTSVGLTIDLPDEEPSRQYHTLSLDFDFFFVRKVMLVRYSVAFVIFPGGFGTFDELFELLNLIHTRKLYPYPVILFDQSFWEPILSFLKNNLLERGFILPRGLEPIHVVSEPKEALDIINNFLVERYTSILDHMHPVERVRTLRLVKNIKKKMSDSNAEHRNQT
jgi:uncharacterized protein (TIGR00730 family)